MSPQPDLKMPFMSCPVWCCSQYLTLHQVGVGVKFGCECMVHSVYHTLEDSNLPANEKWTLLLNFSNAFNCISRAYMFEEFRSYILSLSAWIKSLYGSQPIIYLGTNTILSCSWVQQGDSLGTLGFALTLHPIVTRMKEEIADLKVNTWYLDDGTLCGSPTHLAKAVGIIEEMGSLRGLALNQNKFLLYIPPDADPSRKTLPPKNFLSLEKVSLSWVALLFPHLITTIFWPKESRRSWTFYQKYLI